MQKINLIRKLLRKYDKMSDHCKVKVQPVRDYLIQHLQLLEKIEHDDKSAVRNDENESRNGVASNGAPSNANCTENVTGNVSVIANVKSDNTTLREAAAGNSSNDSEKEDTLVQKNLESIGLGYKSMFVPNFDITQLVKNSLEHQNDEQHKSIDLRNLKAKNLLRSLKTKRQRKNKKDVRYVSEKYRKLVQAAEEYRRKRGVEERIGQLFGLKTSTDCSPRKDISRVEFESPVVISL